MYKITDDWVGSPQPGAVYATDMQMLQGQIQPCFDPVFGSGELQWVRAGGTILVWQAVTVLPTWNAVTLRFDYIATAVANTANQSRPLGIAMQPMVLNDYGWIGVSGTMPVSCTASVASTVPLGVAAAGQLGTAAAGKNVFGMVCAQAATATVVVATAGAYGRIGTKQIGVAGIAGLFVGGYVAGTGIAASNFITAIDEINQVITVSLANTAQVTGNVTQTNNNGAIFYNEVSFSRPSLTNITV